MVEAAQRDWVDEATRVPPLGSDLGKQLLPRDNTAPSYRIDEGIRVESEASTTNREGTESSRRVEHAEGPTHCCHQTDHHLQVKRKWGRKRRGEECCVVDH